MEGFYKHSSIQTSKLQCSQCCHVKYRKSSTSFSSYCSAVRLTVVCCSVGEYFQHVLFKPNIFLKYFHEVEKTILSKLKVTRAGLLYDNYVSKKYDCKKDFVNSSSFGERCTLLRVEYFIYHHHHIQRGLAFVTTYRF